MPSLLEIYRDNNPSVDSDLQQLQKLYKSSQQYQNDYTFQEFVVNATKNSDKELTPDILTIINSNKDYKPNAELRRTFGGIADRVIQGTANSVVDFANSVNTFGQKEYFEKVAKQKNISTDDVLKRVESEGRDLVQEATTKVVKPLYGSDIFIGDKIEEPKTGLGNFAKTMGSLIVPIVAMPKTKLAEGTKNLFKKQAAIGLAKFEAGSQIAFADDPDMLMISGAFNNLLKNKGLSDSSVGQIVDWLDADMDDFASQRRVSLLLENSVAAGLIGGTIFTLGKGIGYSKEQVSNLLTRIKSDPKKVAALKSMMEPITSRLPATRQADDVFVRAEIKVDDNIIGRGTTEVFNFLRQIRRGLFTSRGFKSKEMKRILDITKSANLAIQKDAKNLFESLEASIESLALTGKYSKKEINDRLFAYLEGAKDLRSVPVSLRPFAKRAKNDITELSKKLLETDSVPQELKNVIQLNLGKYLRKTYEIYENKNYKPSQKVIDRAIKHIAYAIQAKPTQKELFDSPLDELTEVELSQSALNQAKNIVDDILGVNREYSGVASDPLDHINKVFSTKLPQIQFATRKNIDEPIRALLGEEKESAAVSVFRSIQALGKYINDTNMYEELYQAGAGKWFFKTGIDRELPEAYRTSATINGEIFGSLNGAKTTPEIARMFNEIASPQRQGPLRRAWNYYLLQKGFGQAFATVYSLTTHARNTIGGSWIMASNGLNPFDRQTRDAFKILQNEIFTGVKNKDEALQELYVKFQRLGIVNQNVRKGEFSDLLNDAAKADWINMTANKFNSTSALGHVRKANDLITRTYVAEDDLFRIAAYTKELATLKRAYPNRAIDDLEREAADIVRNTFPTYDLVPEYAQQLRKLPIGNFYSFQAERIRNNYHTVAQAAKEIRSNNPIIVQRGQVRLASKIGLGYLGGKGITEFSKVAYGITEEEEAAVKDLALPEWSKNSNIAFKRDALGNVQYVDLSYTDPDAPVLDIVRASLNEILDPEVPYEQVTDKLANSVLEGAKALAKPFYGSALFTEALLQAYTGRDENGNFIDGYNPANTAFDNSMAILNRVVYTVLTPKQLREVIDLPEKIAEGDISLEEYLLSEITGQNFYTLTPEQLQTNLYFKAREFKDYTEYSRDIFTDEMTDINNKDDLLEQYLKANQRYYRYQVAMNKAIKGARYLKLPESSIQEATESSFFRAGLNNEESSIVREAGAFFVPLRITDSNFSTLSERGKLSAADQISFQQEYIQLYDKLKSLPLVVIDELGKEEQEALRAINGNTISVRLPKVTGGLVKGAYPVPFVKENPIDRQDKMLMDGSSYNDTSKRVAMFGGGTLHLKTNYSELANNLNKVIGEHESPLEYSIQLDKYLKPYEQSLNSKGISLVKAALIDQSYPAKVNRKNNVLATFNREGRDYSNVNLHNERIVYSTIEHLTNRELNLQSKGMNPSKTAKFLRSSVNSITRSLFAGGTLVSAGKELLKSLRIKNNAFNTTTKIVPQENTLKAVGLSSSENLEKLKTILEKEGNERKMSLGLPIKQKQDQRIIDAALGLEKGVIDIPTYRDLVKEILPVKNWKFVPEPANPVDIAIALQSNKVKKGIVNVNKQIAEGDNIALRLDIPAYNQFDTWVVALKKLNGGGNLYGSTGWIKNVEFDSNPSKAFKIALTKEGGGTSKTPIGIMKGKWKQHTPQEAYVVASQKLKDPEWTQIGYNPFRFSYFYDRTNLNPVVAADEVIQVGPFVIGKNVKFASPTDKRFEVVKNENRFNFEAGGPVYLGGGKSSFYNVAANKLGITDQQIEENYNISARIVNTAIDRGLVDERERIPQDKDGNYILDLTGDAFNAVNHAVLSYRVGDTPLRRTALQAKEVLQAFGDPANSDLDRANNSAGFDIRKSANTDKEREELIYNKIAERTRKLNNRIPLERGKDMFFTFEEMYGEL